MPELKGKTILVISPQSWGKMFLSKHHYAIELAKKGNKVFFLNPPDQQKTERKESISIVNSGVHPNLFFIEHRLFFPYAFKFHAISLFHWLMRFHIGFIIRKISEPLDIVWSFDLGNLYPFHFFSSETYKIFHPVDEPLNQAAITAAKDSQVIFSVTKEIVEKYQSFSLPKYSINHGLASHFLLPVDIYKKAEPPFHVGFCGNLLRNDIDTKVLLEIIDENPDLIFEFWGSYSLDHANIGGGFDTMTESFIRSLRSHRNVMLYGPVPSTELAFAIHKMDAFLICYDVQKDQSKGTNYHKVIEYLSTGKVIVSNNITAYKDQPFFVQMVEERNHNRALPALFKKVMSNLAEYNSPDLQKRRIAFAGDNTYGKQIERLEKFIYEA